MKWFLPLLATAALAVATPARVGAQDQPKQPAENARGKRGSSELEAKRAKVRQRIRALRAWRLTEALDLDEATASRLFPILNRYDEKFAALLQQGAVLRRQLRRQLRGKNRGEPAKTDALIDRMLAHQRATWNLQEQRFKAVRRVLTPEQAATLMVVLPEIDRKIQQQIRQAMKKRRGRGKRGRDRDGARRRGPPAEIADPF